MSQKHERAEEDSATVQPEEGGPVLIEMPQNVLLTICRALAAIATGQVVAQLPVKVDAPPMDVGVKLDLTVTQQIAAQVVQALVDTGVWCEEIKLRPAEPPPGAAPKAR